MVQTLRKTSTIDENVKAVKKIVVWKVVQELLNNVNNDFPKKIITEDEIWICDCH